MGLPSSTSPACQCNLIPRALLRLGPMLSLTRVKASALTSPKLPISPWIGQTTRSPGLGSVSVLWTDNFDPRLAQVTPRVPILTSTMRRILRPRDIFSPFFRPRDATLLFTFGDDETCRHLITLDCDKSRGLLVPLIAAGERQSGQTHQVGPVGVCCSVSLRPIAARRR